MEEEIHYSTLVFNKNASPSKEEKEDVTVYSGVKFAEPVTTEPKENKDPTTTSEFKAKEPEATVSSKFAEIEPVADSHSRTHLLPMCLGILCIILLASIIGLIVYITTVTNKLEANLSNLKGQNEQLMMEKRVLENLTEQVTVKMKMFENQTEQLMMEKRILLNQTEQLTMEKRILLNQTEQLTMEKRVLENLTEQVTVKMKMFENRTEQLMMEKRILLNQTEQLTMEKRILLNQTEQLMLEKRILLNQTEQLTMEKRILLNQTEQLTMEKRILLNQTEQLTMEKRVLENLTEQVTVKMKMFENQTEQLMMEKRRLQNQTEQLSRDRDDLNWTLGVILTFNNFPVNEFCPNKTCQSCRTGWIQYQKKCYLFYEDSPWKTWSDSRQYCKNKNADLVVIDDLQEQKFIGQNTKYYYDKFHGYWMGLQNNGTTWVWIDGHKDTLQYWRTLNEKLYGLTIPGTNISQSWDSGNIEFLNKFICEDDVLIRSN
ncbi:C-type lectin domain family 4 member F-like isoform X2 [Melanotaenia boesemani]|uniref:C-type lectin domain family 4 member F-like isoform X2 n=1 Tax=Melanotaenia boesemani TaxID=1250792 RepID=UPI001C055393|nr:C-type lectin domain family 4 member F-like isoform X2 [Melanotaenia boesemani]